MEQYYIWVKDWHKVEASEALDRLGKHHAEFEPLHVMFFSMNIPNSRLAGENQYAMFVVNDEGDKIYALQRSLVKCVYDDPWFKYLISPADFLDTECVMLIEKGFGNPVAVEIANHDMLKTLLN